MTILMVKNKSRLTTYKEEIGIGKVCVNFKYGFVEDIRSKTW